MLLSLFHTPYNNVVVEISVSSRDSSLFYNASALLAMQTAVIARAISSVCLSVRHIPVFCPDE